MSKKDPIAPFLLVSFFILVLDQLTKYLALAFLPEGGRGSLAVIRGVFHLTLVRNTGVAFGLFKGGTVFFIAATLLCIIALVLLLKKNIFFLKLFSLDSADTVIRFSLGLILGGAVGNLIDRLRFSYVVDFLDFRVWPVFNVADSAITVGGLLIFYRILTKPSHKESFS